MNKTRAKHIDMKNQRHSDVAHSLVNKVLMVLISNQHHNFSILFIEYDGQVAGFAHGQCY